MNMCFVTTCGKERSKIKSRMPHIVRQARPEGDGRNFRSEGELRRPGAVECLYLDFDGFFASVMQQVMPGLRARPVGVIPFETKNVLKTILIACSKEAKERGVTNIMGVADAREICPEILLVPQRPDLYRRAHNALLNEIRCEIPIDVVKSIDEISCRLDRRDIEDPWGFAERIKIRLAANIGPHITCSIGFAANRFLAKIACKMDKPNGVTVWSPEDMPAPILDLPFDDIPGIGARMARRLQLAGIHNVEALWNTQPKQLGKIWRSVTGERFWYALHGYDLQAEPTGRSMFGHARVLHPSWRSIKGAHDTSRLLLTKAARRMRREGWNANSVNLWLQESKGGWGSSTDLPCVHDDHAILNGLENLWRHAREALPDRPYIIRVGTTLMDLTPIARRQLDMFYADDLERQRWEKLTATTDQINSRFGKRLISLRPWTPPPGEYAGAKIAFTRIPSSDDFL